MMYEVAQCRDTTGDWLVSHINYDGDGEMYNAFFSGPEAEARAREYAGVMSHKYEVERPSWLPLRR